MKLENSVISSWLEKSRALEAALLLTYYMRFWTGSEWLPVSCLENLPTQHYWICRAAHQGLTHWWTEPGRPKIQQLGVVFNSDSKIPPNGADFGWVIAAVCSNTVRSPRDRDCLWSQIPPAAPPGYCHIPGTSCAPPDCPGINRIWIRTLKWGF